MNTDKSLQKQNDSGMQEKVQQERRAVAPPVDIYENADEVLVVADLPGVSKENLSIHLDKGQLTIDGQRKNQDKVRAELDLFDYRRTFVLPPGIQADKIAAELNHGILRVHLPKSPALKPRQIEVKAS